VAAQAPAARGPARPPARSAWELRVLDEGGLPVAGATLEVLRPPLGKPIESAATDAFGAVEIGAPRAGDEWSARAEGFAETRFVLDAPPWPREVILVAGKVFFAGQIVDEGLAPIAGARVAMTGEARVWRAVTDAAGDFELRSRDALPPPEVAVLEIDAPGFCHLAQGLPLPIPGYRPGVDRPQIRLLRWAQLAVTVVDEAGSPVPGAHLRFLGPPEEEERRAWSRGEVLVRGAGTTGGSAAGHYVLEHVMPLLELWLEVEHPDLEQVEVPLEAFAPGEVRARTVVLPGLLPEQGAIAFRAVDARSGGPVAGARASVTSGPPEERGTRWMRADGEGRFEVEPPVGEWELAVLAPGFAPLRRTFAAGFRSGEVIVLGLEPSELGIEVHTVPVAGAPRAGVLVRATEVRAGGADLTARTDEEGVARFVGLDPLARYDVSLGTGTPGEYDPRREATWVPSPAAHLDVEAGGAARAFRLVEPASVEGRQRGKDLGEARAHLSLIVPEARRDRPLFTVSSPLDGAGRFAFHGLPPGRYHLWCEAAGSPGPFEPLEELDLMEGQRLAGLEVGR
jgi:hypothetical protein